LKKSANVLVVDDNTDLLNTFALILKRKGYIVDIAEDGIQALDKFKARQFDVILMDAVMPRMNGIEALHKMREIDPAAKIILMTAFCEEEQLKKALKEGAFGALYKPVDIAKLMDLIGQVTGNASILVVDDDDAFRSSMARVLELQNFKVVTAANGEEAIKIARQKTINMAFVDIKMSVMDGLTTSLKLKEINPELMIVMMTGYRDEVKDIVEEATGKGVLKCLYKPFDMVDLKQLVNQTL
jgi:two-component system, NtrC family, response regulator HydG